jgi:hypothetical protein
MPGLAPQQLTAVVPPGRLRRAAWIVRARFGPELGVEVEARPRLDHGIDVERTDVPA